MPDNPMESIETRHVNCSIEWAERMIRSSSCLLHALRVEQVRSDHLAMAKMLASVKSTAKTDNRVSPLRWGALILPDLCDHLTQ